ncbi:hypothetical protein AZE42_13073 [Rhizopogon vesiculosus]|uniref:Uncharacterized protein n=1 Tax=Rhizopogon vesiculosus TaxID=180088 RepID=A0A1J8Q401_9AGAM|nr:hypothetical protein AZE42_13073 [Rhizopogon vesiculosus]
MHNLYSPVAEATLEASAPPLLSLKELTAPIVHLQNLEIIAERGQLFTMSIKLS